MRERKRESLYIIPHHNEHGLGPVPRNDLTAVGSYRRDMAAGGSERAHRDHVSRMER